ncbi:alpha/beta fold hydrolase [Streptomyces sp. NBC_01465]|uniref:alpha/beta fold hydrolase n=1 Tax=Streptomyces sp. NBC_01465 TaxID=2903878 RepID=UPI002E35932C|nr:alpha/beta hydrolase [Streptomyces sp. NBC_01465]
MPHADGARHSWVQSGEVSLHTAEFGPLAGTPVVLLHGFPQHWYAWRKLVPLLSPDHRLICVDLRGFGWSEQPKRGYDTDTLAGDILALLDSLGLERTALIAHNWGAGVGFRLCAQHSDRISAYVALNMTHPWTEHRHVLPNLWRMWFTAPIEYPLLGRLVLRHCPRFTRYLLRRAAPDPTTVWNESDLKEFAEATQTSAHAGQSLFWQYVLRDIPAGFRGTHRRTRLKVPTVVLGGELDPVIPPTLLQGAPNADDLTVETIPGAGGHLPEEHPEVVAAALRRLTAARPAAPPH